LLAAFLLLFIGAAVLLAAPGNYLRLQHPGFDSFNALSLAEKASYHFFQRTPRVFTKSKLAYFLWLVVLFWLLFTDKKPRLFDDKKRPTAFALMLVFMGLAFGATAAQML